MLTKRRQAGWLPPSPLLLLLPPLPLLLLGTLELLLELLLGMPEGGMRRSSCSQGPSPQSWSSQNGCKSG